MKVTAEITVTLKVTGEVKRVGTSNFCRVLSDNWVQMRPDHGYDMPLGRFTAEVQDQAIAALEMEGRKLLAVPDPIQEDKSRWWGARSGSQDSQESS